jgi:tripartite-type tricarboxylate transporter receptor subunit TctC
VARSIGHPGETACALQLAVARTGWVCALGVGREMRRQVLRDLVLFFEPPLFSGPGCGRSRGEELRLTLSKPHRYHAFQTRRLPQEHRGLAKGGTTMDRRSFVVGSAASATALALPAAAQEAYPSHAVTIINPFPPGGAVDVVCRPFAAVLEGLFKQPVVIETKAGAAGAVGAQFAAAARPDGYTLLAHLPSISGFEAVDRLFGRTPKFTRASFVPIARLTEGPMLLVVNDKTPYTTLKEFVDDAKKRPNELIFSSSGLYGALHLPTALFTKATGIQMRHLPTNGGGPALTAILGNNSQVLVTSIAAAIAHIRAGKLKALACFSPRRAAAAPGVPTLKELGYDVQFSIWAGLFAPKGTPDGVIRRLREETAKAVAVPQFVQAIQNIGDVVAHLDQPEFAKFWDEDARRVEDAVQTIGKV